MARIRSIKPEFWTDEKVVELSAFARLLFIGIWNFCDDDGRTVYSPKRLKMQIFPADNVDCFDLSAELVKQRLVLIYEVNGIEYLQVIGFAKHQKIDKRSASKLPPPPNPSESLRIPPTEGKGLEGNGETPLVLGQAEDDMQPPPASHARNECPHQEIIALYHEVLPQCPQVRDWTSARATQLRARWYEDEKRQNLDYWRRFFEYVAACDFLVGKGRANKGAAPFMADLEWLTKSANFTKVREEKYANRETR